LRKKDDDDDDSENVLNERKCDGMKYETCMCVSIIIYRDSMK